MEARGILINTVLIALFFVALISIGINLAENNGVNNLLLQNSKINETFTDVNGSIKTFSGTTTSKYNSLTADTPEAVNEITLFTIPRIIISLPFFLFDTMTSLMNLIMVTLGISPVVFYAISSIIVIIIITLIWSFIRIGK